MREKLDSDHRRWFTCAHTILHLCVARDNMQLWVARRNMWRGLKSVAVGTCVCVCVCVCAHCVHSVQVFYLCTDRTHLVDNAGAEK